MCVDKNIYYMLRFICLSLYSSGKNIVKYTQIYILQVQVDDCTMVNERQCTTVQEEECMQVCIAFFLKPNPAP